MLRPPLPYKRLEMRLEPFFVVVVGCYVQVGGDVSTWPRELPFSSSLGVTLELVAIAVIYCKKTLVK